MPRAALERLAFLPLTLAARAAVAGQAFVAGRRLGEEWARGDTLKREVRRVLAAEGALALATGAAAAATAAFALVRRKEAIALGAAGFAVGSGLASRALERLPMGR